MDGWTDLHYRWQITILVNTKHLLKSLNKVTTRNMTLYFWGSYLMHVCFINFCASHHLHILHDVVVGIFMYITTCKMSIVAWLSSCSQRTWCASRRKAETWSWSTSVCRRNSTPTKSSKCRRQQPSSQLRSSLTTNLSAFTRTCGPSASSLTFCESSVFVSVLTLSDQWLQRN